MAMAQNKVAGTVINDQGQPMVAVSVYIDGTTKGVSTDNDGKYAIDVQKGQTLVFSCLGYIDQKFVINKPETLDVKLQTDVQSLDELVVVGYGTSSKRYLTTAITKVDGSSVRGRIVSSVGDALKGKVAGARVYTTNNTPGADPTIMVRGGSSINGSNSPLILVDGVERGLAGLNPNDIESVEVLKDATSTAIYGSRGSNGVVLITTRIGNTEQKPVITFSATAAVQGPETLYDMMDGEGYIKYVRTAAQFYEPYVAKLSKDGYSVSSANSSKSVYSTRYLNAGETVPKGYKSMADPLDPSKTLIFEDNDWQKEMYKTTAWQNYNLSVDGGTSKTKYLASIGYIDDDGVALETGYRRLDTRIKLTSNISDRLRFRANADFSDSKNQYLPNQMNQVARGLSQAPVMKKYFDDGTPAYGYNKTSMSPLYYEYVNTRDRRYKRISVMGGLTWQIFDFLKADVQVSRFDQDMRLGVYENANYFSSDRSTYEGYSETKRDLLDSYLEYSDAFGKHSVDLMGGYSYRRSSDNAFNATATGRSTDKVVTLSSASTYSDEASSFSDAKMDGFFSRLNYDYAKKYFMTFTFRADGSSKFLKGHRWGYFPGAAASWIMSEENFMKEASAINFLKLRISYGQTGNNDVGIHDAIGTYGVSRYDGNVGMASSTMANEDLTWETTTQLDAGMDLQLFNGRIAFIGDYYRKVTSNLLFSKDLPNTSGFASVKTNIGKVLFYGFDIDLSTTNIKRHDFTWTSKFTYSFVRNKVLKLPSNGRDRNRIGGYTLADGTAFGGTAEGEPLYRIYGYKMDHIIQTDEEAANAYYDTGSKGYDPMTGISTPGRKFAGDYEWKNRIGSDKRNVNGKEVEQINSQDRFLLGYTVPHSTGGLDNTITFQDFTFDLYLDYAIGHSVLNSQKARLFLNTFEGNYAIHSDVSKCWTEVGDTNAKYARFVTSDELQSNNFRTSSVFCTRGDYLCIREVSLAYKLPLKITKLFHINGASVVLSGNNLYYFTAVEGVSPEVGTSSTYSSSYNNLPPTRRVSIGIKLTI